MSTYNGLKKKRERRGRKWAWKRMSVENILPASGDWREAGYTRDNRQGWRQVCHTHKQAETGEWPANQTCCCLHEPCPPPPTPPHTHLEGIHPYLLIPAPNTFKTKCLRFIYVESTCEVKYTALVVFMLLPYPLVSPSPVSPLHNSHSGCSLRLLLTQTYSLPPHHQLHPDYEPRQPCPCDFPGHSQNTQQLAIGMHLVHKALFHYIQHSSRLF